MFSFLKNIPTFASSSTFYSCMGKKTKKANQNPLSAIFSILPDRENNIKLSLLSRVTANCRFLGAPAELISPYLSLRFGLRRISLFPCCALFHCLCRTFFAEVLSTFIKCFIHYTTQQNSVFCYFCCVPRRHEAKGQNQRCVTSFSVQSLRVSFWNKNYCS